VPKAHGVVLELGFGSGLNLPFYDPARVTRVIALEPSEGMLVRARKAASEAPNGVQVDILPETAEALSIPDASVDTVLVTYSLCTIPDPHAALEGARRALKPGGKLLFCEHGLAPDEKIARTQRRLDPLWSKIAGGCHLSRDIPALIRAAGFVIEDLDTMYLPKSPRFAGFNTWGAAAPTA
jgi:ubiquinone/menaquinone biosynthesis C-methylase UbiE